MGGSAPPVDTPLVLGSREGNRRIVAAADKAARRMGIAPGMAITQARAMLANLHIEEYDSRGDVKALVELAHWALKRYSPVIATETDGLWIDASGCAHLFGGEEGMLADLVGKLKSFGITARAAMAPTYGAAFAFARTMSASVTTVSEYECAAELSKLPISALRIPAEVVDGLVKLGIETIAELKAKPRKSLTLRFGPEIGRRLDQALGCAAEAMEPVTLPETISLRRAFAEPISNPDTIKRYITMLTDTLCETLERKVLGARCLDLVFTRVDNSIQTIRIRLAKPRRDAKQLARLMNDKLETIDPGFGIEVMTLSVLWMESFDLQQTHMGMGEKQKPDIASLIDTLSNRIGSHRVYQIIPQESDVPERSIAQVAALSSRPQATWPVKWPRPVRLFARPERIETIAMLPDHPPMSFTWRGHRHKIRCADGPERITGEWWKHDSEMEAVRDYFQLEDETGGRFWVFRSGDGVQPQTGSLQWFLHGVFA